MTQQTQTDEKRGGALDTVWLLAALAVIAGAIVAFYYFQAEYNALIRAVGILAAIGLSAAMLYQTQNGRAAWGYVQGSRIELRKVVWPTRQESVQTTLLIAVVVLIVALMLWGLDSLLLMAVKAATGRG